jgi:hypothetical protein
MKPTTKREDEIVERVDQKARTIHDGLAARSLDTWRLYNRSQQQRAESQTVSRIAGASDVAMGRVWSHAISNRRNCSRKYSIVPDEP